MQALTALEKTLKAGRMSLKNVTKTTVYLTDWKDNEAMDKVYSEFFSEPFPARSLVQVKFLPGDARVEIDAVAVDDTK
ncbi:translation initiation inhibitor UK114/IBM1, putative [Ixodes scapularis]|uniref:Translation initiation inhibitor UK114/IBM1, putative n=1 Tax=Ixodes scapularis TaxID=6945 RepID=B7QB79_IXOSC|nr:translation initiation inhibitor UK114/IBM1, putative [Ixodes scapularis]|eukprot:XP_002412805.1 translation initiation inhibitor UK114/IBM1, putative [Ixodes scapularis]